MTQSDERYISPLINKLFYAYFIRVPREHVIRIAKNNKVLYQLGNLFPEVQRSFEWCEISKRRSAQIEELIRFNEVANEVGLKYVVVKTFRFPEYVPDDVDILVHPNSRHLIPELISVLVERYRYFLRSKGTTEITIRKVMRDTYVDFDIHVDLGAGPYVYLNPHVVFRNSVSITLQGKNIPTVSQKLEFIICAAHAIMKEFEITLADIMTYLYLYSIMEGNNILEFARKLGLSKAVHSFCMLSQHLTEKILAGKKTNLPYRIPIYYTAIAYIENTTYKMKFAGLETFRELFSFPRAKGIKKLFNL